MTLSLTDAELLEALARVEPVAELVLDAPADVTDAESAAEEHPIDVLGIGLPDPAPGLPPGPWYIWGDYDPANWEIVDGEPFDRGAATTAFVQTLVAIRWNRYPNQRPETLELDDLVGTVLKKLMNGSTWSDEEAAGLGSDDKSMVWNRWQRGRVTWSSFLAKQVDDRCLWTLREYGFLTRWDRDRVMKLIQVEGRLTETLGREPTDDEIGAAFTPPISAEAARQCRIVRDHFTVRALDDATISSWFGRRSAESDALEGMEREMVQIALSALPPRTARILASAYGHEMRPKEIAAQFGLTPTRIAQLRREGVVKLRDFLYDFRYLSPADQARVAAAMNQAPDQAASDDITSDVDEWARFNLGMAEIARIMDEYQM